MSDDATVTFGATIDPLTRGVEAAKHSIESIKESTDKVIEGAKALIEAFALERIVEAAKQAIEKMAELGEQTERTAAILGASTKQVQELDFIAKITGGSAEGLSFALVRLERNLQQATHGTGPAVAALEALGLSAKKLIGVPIPEQLNLIADRFAKYADGGNKTALATELLGRSGAQLIPVLDKGRAGLDELRAAAAAGASILSHETVQGLADVHIGMVRLEAATTGLQAAIVGRFSASIKSSMDVMTTYTSNLSRLIQTSRLGEFVFEAFATAIDGLAAKFKLLAVLLADLGTLSFSRMIADYKAGIALQEQLTNQHYDKMKAMVATAEAELTKLREQHGSDKPNAPATPDISGILAAQMKEIEGEIAAVKAGVDRKKAIYEYEVMSYKMTEQQKLQATMQAVQQAAAAQMTLYQQELQLGNLKLAQRQEIENKIVALKDKTNTELIKLDTDAATKMADKFKAVFSDIQSAWDGQLRGLLAGTTSWKDAMKNIGSDLTLKMISYFEKIGLEWLATQLGMTTSSTTQSGARAAEETAATSAGEAAKLAAVTTGAASGEAVEKVSAFEKIQASIGVFYASLSAFLAPEMGPAAPGVAAAEAAGVESAAVGLASLDVGAWSVPHNMVAQIHQGEMVVPENFASGLRGAVGGSGGSGSGGGDNHTHIHMHGPFVQAIDTQTGAHLMRKHVATIAEALKQHLRDVPSMAPGHG